MKVGLFFGSFNPIHIGHKVIASYMVEYTKLDMVWFVVSPQNPLKKKSTLLHEHHRFMIVKREVEDNKKLSVSDIEFKIAKPSYTIDTLKYLEERFPNNVFSLIIGADNLASLSKWKNHEQILKNYKIYVYPRNDYNKIIKHKNIFFIKNVPKMEISSSFIRKGIVEGKDVSYLVPEKAWHYIEEMNFYKNKLV